MEKTEKILQNQEVSPQEKVSAFSGFCWTTDLKEMAFLYNVLCQEFSVLSNTQKIDIIPELIRSSFKYNFLLHLGHYLLKTLPEYERIKVDVAPIWWAMCGDQSVIITQEEYVWRCLHKNICYDCKNGIYIRPCTIGDVDCLEKSFEMFKMTHNPYPWLFN